MRIVYFTAGAAGMYCGSCMRDNTLAAALHAQGRDILLVPLYTPIRTDEPDVSEPRVLYGGLNVYLQQRSAFFRRAPLVDRILDRPSLLRRLTGGGQPSWAELGEMTVSTLRGEHGRQRRELRKLVNWLREIRPDLVNLPNVMFLGVARAVREALGVPVVCTLTGEDIFLDRLPDPYRGRAIDLIRRAADDVDAFVAISRYYAEYASENLAIPRDRTHVVPAGIRTEDLPGPSEPPPGPFTIGYLARICPEKGLHLLCEAFAILHRAGRDCHLRAAGFLSGADRPYFDGVRRYLAENGLDASFRYAGEVDRAGKIGFLRSLHVFSVPTVYREAKGLYVLEAMANGAPVVQPAHGAFPEILEATAGGVLVPPGDAAALADAIAELMDDPARRRDLACRGRATVLKSYTAEVMARRMWALYEEICSARKA